MQRIGTRAAWLLLVVALGAAAAFVAGTRPLDRTPILGSAAATTTRKALTAAARVAPEHGPLEIGFRAVDITPPAGTPTLGYGARRGRGAHWVDRLRAVAFALRVADGPPVVLLTADLCFWPRELSAPLAERLVDVLPRERLFFGATHTHGGPGAIVDAPVFSPMFGAYSEAIAERVIGPSEAAVRGALAALAPGGFRVHSFPLPEFVRNRTGSGAPVNDRAVVLELVRSDDRRAALVTYSAHATVVSQDVVLGSADYPGAWTRALEEAGFELAGFFAAETAQAGPAHHGARASANDAELAHSLGRRLAAQTLTRLEGTTGPLRREASLATLRAPVTLPDWRYRIPGFERSLRPTLVRWLLGGRAPDAHVHAVALDELIFVGHGFEQSAELGHVTRRWARERGRVLVPTSFNGEHHFYVVPERAYDAPGYEPTMAMFGPDLGPYLDGITRRVAESIPMPSRAEGRK